MEPFLCEMTVLAVLLGGVSAMAAEPARCIDTIRIDRTKSPDDRTLIFYMKDGSSYQSTLASACPGLAVNGFSYVATPPHQICGNLQSIRVLRTGSVCLLGPLVPITPSSTRGG